MELAVAGWGAESLNIVGDPTKVSFACDESTYY